VSPARRGWRLLVAAGVALGGSLGLAGAAAASGVPYSDPSAVGYIGLCDQAGHQITSGSINSTPFAWRAVSSQPAPAPYNNSYRTAILLAYQPQQGLSAGEWSGDELTASSRYTNPASPMAAATAGDDSLEDFIEEFHPKWDGFFELRMYLGTQNQEQYEQHYPVLNIKVTGDTWTAVGGGAVNCSSGSAESLESIVLPTTTSSPSTTGAKSPVGATVPGSGTGPSGGSSTPGATSTGSSTQSGGGHGPSTNRGPGPHPVALAADPSRAPGHGALVLAVIAAAVLVLGAGAVLFARRRRRFASPSPTGPVLSSSTKGH
jgi:hypothetical protein